jgi:NADH:ubiquinone oxidoreductase subunit E
MPSKTPVFARDSDHFYAERVSLAVSDEIMQALRNIQKTQKCKGKVPVLEIEVDGRYYELMPRQRLYSIATRYTREQIKEEQAMLLRLCRR